MKTAMQELIDIITTELEISEDIVEYSQQELNVFARVRNSAIQLLEKEKEQLQELKDEIESLQYDLKELSNI